MLDFRREDGTIKEKSLYEFAKKHRTDPEVLKIKSMPGTSLVAKYKRYLDSVGTDNNAESNISSQEFDYEAGTSTSSKILTFDKPLTEEELLKQHGYDVLKWKIAKHSCSKWQSGDKTLMSSKIYVKPRNILEGSPAQLVQAINKALEIKPIDFSKMKDKVYGSKLLVLPISDLHFGLLADLDTSGNTYNMEIAESRLSDYVKTAIENTKLTKKDRILVTFGNDFFNCDNVQGTTCHGTPQDNEGSYFTIWDRGVALGISVIEYLLKTTECNIDIASVQGNHDFQSSHAMLVALYYNYKNTDRVRVFTESDEKARFYYTFGENLIGFGHETKIKECHRIMSSECSNWSAHKYRTMFLGHLHKEEVFDTGALVVRRLPILSGKSTWTDEQGYMAHPRAQAFTFDSERGLVNTVNVEIIDPRRV